MKSKRLFVAVMAMLGIVCCFTSTMRADDEADRAALRLIRTNYMEAVNSGQIDELAPYLSKDVTGVMVTGEEVKGLDGLKAYWKKIQGLIGPGGSYHVNVNVDKTDLYGDVAVSRGSTEDVVRLGNGKELHFGSYWASVCHKEDGGWKVVRMEAVMNPVENVFISLRLLKTKLAYGIGGLILGALLAFVIHLLGRRPKTMQASK
ncbi:MAG TPA: nuclear transport factor 2 family protein [Candidatus Angelobacter sp.]|nr:nuclear transport factor 2 family protein [Candidatus Angelobacter sp.]